MPRFSLEDWLPPLLHPCFRDFRSWLAYLIRANSRVVSRNLQLHDLKSSDSAVIFATGPSVRDFDLSSFSGVDCFSVSNFFLHEDLKQLNLKMHFFAPWHPPLIRENYLHWLENAHRVLPPQVSIGLGFSDFQMIEDNDVFGLRQRFYFYLSGRASSRASLTGPIKAPQTGPLFVLPIVMALGYRKIYLVGCDHNTLKDYGENIQHFYDLKKDVRLNASSKEAWQSGILDNLYSTVRTFEEYEGCLRLARQKGIEIYNCSKKSWLDFIPYNDRFESID